MKIEKFQHENYLKQIECLHCVGKKNWLASLVFLSFNIYNDLQYHIKYRRNLIRLISVYDFIFGYTNATNDLMIYPVYLIVFSNTCHLLSTWGVTDVQT